MLLLTVKFDISTEPDKPIRVRLEGLTGLENIDNLTIKEVLSQHFMVQIPAKTFAWKLKSINLADVSEADIEAEAAVCNRLSEIWKNDVFDENEEVNIGQMKYLWTLQRECDIRPSIWQTV